MSWVVMIVTDCFSSEQKGCLEIFVLSPACSPTQYEPSLTQVGSPLGADPGGDIFHHYHTRGQTQPKKRLARVDNPKYRNPPRGGWAFSLIFNLMSTTDISTL